MKVKVNELNGWTIEGEKHSPGSVITISENTYDSAVAAGLKITKVTEKSETEHKAKAESGKSK